MVKDKEVTKIQELAHELKVDTAMTKDVVVVHPQTQVKELREVFRAYRISGVPVIDNDKLVGIISLEDFIKCLAKGETHSPVSERMTKEVEILYSDESLISAMNKFEQFGFGRFPVINRESQKLVGIITKGDIIKTLLKKLESDYCEEEIRRFRASHIFEDIISDRTTLIFGYEITGGDFKHAGECASRLKKSLLRLGMNPKIVRSVSIATYEAEMNVIIFTSGGGINAYVEPDKIRVKVVDSGPGIPDIEQALKPGFSTAPDWIRAMGFGAGMGLPNIKNCVDRLDISSKVGEGTKLEFVVDLNKGERK